MTTRDLVLRLAASPTGTTYRDAAAATGRSQSVLGELFRKLMAEGLLHKHETAGAAARFFGSVSALELHRRLWHEAQAAKVHKSLHKHHGRATWSAEEPAVITEKTRITICPRFADPSHTNTHSPWGG